MLFKSTRRLFAGLLFIDVDCQSLGEEDKNSHDDGNKDQDEIYRKPRAVFVHQDSGDGRTTDTSSCSTKCRPQEMFCPEIVLAKAVQEG